MTFLDMFGLEDAFLARIPYQPEPDWRIGHFVRQAPAGYLQTVQSGKNQIENPCLREYYDVLHQVISGPLFTADRWKAIVGLNFGVYDHLTKATCPTS
jgi:arabinofuranosyltransferase